MGCPKTFEAGYADFLVRRDRRKCDRQALTEVLLLAPEIAPVEDRGFKWVVGYVCEIKGKFTQQTSDSERL